MSKILVLAPHTDDGELGCGATISKLISENNDVYYVAFSTADKSVPLDMPRNILEIEVKRATEKLGIPSQNLFIHKYEVRKLNYFRQDILEELIRYRRDISPDIVFMPSANDIHQDHSTVFQEGLRAFKTITILGYELPWNNISFNAQSFSVVSEADVKRKIQALAEYGSQSGRNYMAVDYIEGWARMRGVQINKEFAECFEVIRSVF